MKKSGPTTVAQWLTMEKSGSTTKTLATIGYNYIQYKQQYQQ
jgi:hypothetical protein